jgi:hypothetical protein
LTGFGPGGAVTTLPAGGSALSIGDPELRDIDGDGRGDLLVSDHANGRVSWWNGRGDGTFSSPHPDLLVANNTEPFAQVSYLVNTSINLS